MAVLATTACLFSDMSDKAVILVGMMGVGKSTLGTRIAESLDREFVDTDRLLVQRLGRPISQLFAIYGEQTFREHETAILRSLEPGPRVISTGGGIILKEENWVEMKRLGTTVFLDVPVDRIIERLRNSKKRRPLLEVKDPDSKIREIYKARLPLYLKAEVRVEIADEEIEMALETALKTIENYI